MDDRVSSRTSPAVFSRILLSCLLLCLPVSCRKPAPAVPTLESLAGDLGVSFAGAGDYLVRKDVSDEGGSRTVEAGAGSRVVRIESAEKVGASGAEAFIAERRHALRALFQNAPSPYPGVISREIAMPERYAPRVVEASVGGRPAEVYLLPGTSRLTYGAKTEDTIRYRGGVSFVFDPARNRVFRIDFFIPREEYRLADLLDLFASLRFAGMPAAADKTASAEGGKETRRDNVPAPSPGTGKRKEWNLIIVGFEPLGAAHVGAYGYLRPTTPNLDRFAKDAVLFRNAVSPSSWTLPTFMSMFTSLYPSQHTLTNKYVTASMQGDGPPRLSRISDDTVTLAQVLRGKGFLTAGFTGGAALSDDFGYGRGFAAYFDDATFGGFDLTLPKAEEWLGANAGKRFFLFVQGFDVHGRFPLAEGAEKAFLDGPYSGRYRGTVEEYWALRDANLDDPFFTLASGDRAFWTAHYDAQIREADRRFGAFLAEVSRLGLMEDTVIIVTSGSGNEYLEHGGIDHGLTLYDELVLVPLVIRVPGKKGRVVRGQVRTLDIMPTALALLGIDPGSGVSARMQGVSLAPALDGAPLRLDAFLETDYLVRGVKRGVRTADGWKFIHSLDSGVRELYDLNKDPGEKENLVEIEKDRARRLENRLLDHLERIKAPSPPGGGPG